MAPLVAQDGLLRNSTGDRGDGKKVVRRWM